jgi:hypothetical protein
VLQLGHTELQLLQREVPQPQTTEQGSQRGLLQYVQAMAQLSQKRLPHSLHSWNFSQELHSDSPLGHSSLWQERSSSSSLQLWLLQQPLGQKLQRSLHAFFSHTEHLRGGMRGGRQRWAFERSCQFFG